MTQCADGYTMIEEYYVIANPPADTSKLYLLICNYNESTIHADTILKYPNGHIHRAFYKQTDELTEDYQENSSFLSDRISDHANERVADITYQYQPPRHIIIDWFIGHYIDQRQTIPIDSLTVFWKNQANNIHPPALPH
ncbi:MAG: hypothetical protein JXR39_08860 [Marinilabiliaceae bacterium]|nr:hypothetical protein [Marinilabiliaceae bacterium]